MKKPLLILILFVALVLNIQRVFAFDVNEKNILDAQQQSIENRMENLNIKIDNLKNQNDIYEKNGDKLIKMVDVNIDRQNDYYKKVMDYLTIFGILVVATAMIVGLYKNKEIADARKDFKEQADELFLKIEKDCQKITDNALENLKQETRREIVALQEFFENQKREQRDEILTIIEDKSNGKKSGISFDDYKDLDYIENKKDDPRK